MKIDVTLMGTTFPDVTVDKEGRYADGSPALRLYDEEGPVATATVWLQEPPAYGCVWIKDWSENDGMLDSLVRAGVVEATGRTAVAGFSLAHEARHSLLAARRTPPVPTWDRGRSACGQQ